MENKDHSAEDKNENLFYIINDFFQKDGRAIQAIIEDYIVNRASNFLAQQG